MARSSEDQSRHKSDESTYDDPFRQSSVLPYQVGENGLEIMMVTSIRRRRWIIPKGVVEPDMTPQDSAAKEAFEEAGIKGIVIPEPLGRYHYKKWAGICRCDVFAMKVETVLDEWQEQDDREREWVDAKEAVDRLRHKRLKTIVRRFIERHLDRS